MLAFVFFHLFHEVRGIADTNCATALTCSTAGSGATVRWRGVDGLSGRRERASFTGRTCET